MLDLFHIQLQAVKTYILAHELSEGRKAAYSAGMNEVLLIVPEYEHNLTMLDYALRIQYSKMANKSMGLFTRPSLRYKMLAYKHAFEILSALHLRFINGGSNETYCISKRISV